MHVQFYTSLFDQTFVYFDVRFLVEKGSLAFGMMCILLVLFFNQPEPSL